MPVVSPIASSPCPINSPFNPPSDNPCAFDRVLAAFSTVPKFALPLVMSSITPKPPANTPPTPNKLLAPPPDKLFGLDVLS